MTRLSLTLLGGFQVRLDSGPAIALPTRKAQALLAYLALPLGQAHPRDKLAALLWGGIREDSARASLRQALFAIRKALGETDALLVEASTVALAAAVTETDADEFTRAVGRGDPEALARAADLYRGDLLAGLVIDEAPFEEWLLGERERLRELALEGLAKLLAHQRRSGAAEPAVATALKLLTLDPLQEPVHRSLMRLYADLGRRGAALRQYQQCVSALQRELGTEPEADTKALYQQILRQGSAREPSTTLSSPPSPVPVVTHEASLIGRERELAQLLEALDAACGGRAQTVAVLGEAGIGKSRLLAELTAEAARRGARVFLGRAHESEQILPFGPWVDAFRTGNGLDAEDLSTLGSAWIGELARLFPELATASDRPPADADQLRLFDALVRFVAYLAARQPVVLVLEDLHWADEVSCRFFSFLGRRLVGRPVLLVGTAREEDVAGAPTLRGVLRELRRDARLVQISIAALTRPETLVLVRELARAGIEDAALARLVEQTWTVSEGNPFIAVETLRAVRERPDLDPSAVLPARVRELIAGRLERLSPRTRDVVSVAAVIGREFDFALLQKACGTEEREVAEAMEELVRRRVLHAVGERFDFAHDRIRDVVYGDVLPPRRTFLHGAVARALEAVYADALEPPYAALGFHFREGEVWDTAVSYLRRAGTQASVRSALPDARVWFEQALDALRRLPESPSTLEQAFEIRLELRSVLIGLGEVRTALECMREAETFAERLDDEHRRARVRAFMTNIHALLGELDEARASGNRALAIARKLDDPGLRYLTSRYLEQVHHLGGDYERAVESATADLTTAPDGRISPNLGTGFWLAMSLAQLGRFSEAAAHGTIGIQIAASSHRPYVIGQAHRAVGMVHLLQGEWAKACSFTEHAVAVFREGNVLFLLPYVAAASAWALAQLGETSDALNRLQESERLLDHHSATGTIGYRGWTYGALGHACLRLGRVDDARRLANRAIESSPCHAGFRAQALHLCGDIATRSDRFDAEASAAHYREALALAEPRGMRPLVAHCRLGLGKLSARTGDKGKAHEHLEAAATLYRDMGMGFWLAQAEATLG